jgi:DNA-directed RNA polymerase subunit omega
LRYQAAVIENEEATKMKLKNGFDSNYRYVLVAARRARQISGGAPPLVETPARKPCKIAQEEIAAGKVQYVVKDVVKDGYEAAVEPAPESAPGQ